MTIIETLRANRIMVIEGQDHIITGGSAYLTRSGQSVAVTLDGPRDPRDPDAYPVPRHRVYLPLEWVASATEPQHLLNAAQHRARRWLDDCKADYWHALLVIACRPLRAKCKPLLHAIAKTARNHWGEKYWRHADAREMLDRELRMIGVKTPPPISIVRFLPANPSGS
jgi:hypothetical protein